jgi:hypothetical protein
MALLRELDEDQPAEAAPGAPTPSAAAADRTCDQLIAMLRARLASR